MDLNEVAKHCLEISKKRIANGSAMTQDNLKHCAEEIVESVQAREEYKSELQLGHFMCISEEDKMFYKDNFIDELMDILVCVLVECAENEIDVEQALLKCINKNNKRALCIGDKL